MSANFNRTEGVGWTQAISTATGTGNLTINRPSATVAGGLLFALFGTRHSATTSLPVVNLPSGWEMASEPVSGTVPVLYAAYKIAGASEPSSYAFEFVENVTFIGHKNGSIFFIEGADTSSPINVAARVGGGYLVSPAANSVTTGLNDCLVFAMVGYNHGNELTAVDGDFVAGWDDIYARTTTTSSSGHIQAVAVKTQAIAGATGDATFTNLRATGFSSQAMQIAILSGASGPNIESVVPDTITATSTPLIIGTNFGATPSAVLLSPSNSRLDAGAATQTIGSGSNESIQLTGVILPAGVTAGATLYYFVQAQDLTWSEGFPVTFSVQPTLSAPEVFNPTLNGFSFRFTTDAANGTAIWAAYATTTQRNAATIADIQAEITTPATSLARGQFTVTVAGVQTVSAITGLGAAQTRHIRVFHDGDVTV